MHLCACNNKMIPKGCYYWYFWWVVCISNWALAVLCTLQVNTSKFSISDRCCDHWLRASMIRIMWCLKFSQLTQTHQIFITLSESKHKKWQQLKWKSASKHRITKTWVNLYFFLCHHGSKFSHALHHDGTKLEITCCVTPIK